MDKREPIQVDDFEQKYAQEQALKKLKNNIGLFGKTMFPTALNKDVPPFHHEIYRNLSDDEEKRVLIAAPRGLSLIHI